MKVYLLMWAGKDPCVTGVFVSPSTAFETFTKFANVKGWTFRQVEHGRWAIFDEHGGYSHRYVQAHELNKMIIV